jgi:hypothetical protein
MQTRAHRWRFNLATGATREEDLSDRIMEFGMINGRHGGRPYRYAYNMTAPPGRFLFDGLVKHDLQTGREERFAFGDGVFASETPMAPRRGGSGEDDGYLVTFVIAMNADRSECWIFAAQDLAAGPIARVALPARISSGTHACWAPAEALSPLLEVFCYGNKVVDGPTACEAGWRWGCLARQEVAGQMCYRLPADDPAAAADDPGRYLSVAPSGAALIPRQTGPYTAPEPIAALSAAPTATCGP